MTVPGTNPDPEMFTLFVPPTASELGEIELMDGTSFTMFREYVAEIELLAVRIALMVPGVFAGIVLVAW
jgi:hypothetical protein